MRLKTKLLILRILYLLFWLARLPVALVLLPFDLVLRLLSGLYAAWVLVTQKTPNVCYEDKKTALECCGCEVCKQELKRMELEQNYLKVNETREKCKFCGKPTVLNPKTQKHYCPDCG